MKTYKQNIKEKSREILWNHAVRSLTQDRMEARVLNSSYLDKLWDFIKERFDERPFLDSRELDDYEFEDWKRFGEITYGNKKPEELKVAFFCGPEPENDVNHLVRLGVRIENMYAFEYDKNCFKEAVDSLHFTFPNLKIFRGKIQDFLSLNEVKFDIIYLDFTRSLIAEFKAVFQVLESNVLSDLGILVVNTTYPDMTDENVDFLTRFYYYSRFYELSALNGYDEYYEKEETDDRIVESCGACGYDADDVKSMVKEHFESAYAVFQTRMIILYANLIKPVVAALNNKILQERIFASSSEIIGILNDENREFDFLQSHYEDDLSPISLMLENMGCANSLWKHFFEEDPSRSNCRLRCVKVTEQFVESKYENYEDILSAPLKKQLDIVDKELIGGRYGLFCDVPMVHLWLEMMLHQFGHTYHQNTANHRRYSYKAKTRKMCLDLFTFDKCRMLYDWLPLVEYLGTDAGDATRQMICRMSLDAIGKHSMRILNELYYGSALIGTGERNWSYHKTLPNRREIL